MGEIVSFLALRFQRKGQVHGGRTGPDAGAQCDGGEPGRRLLPDPVLCHRTARVCSDRKQGMIDDRSLNTSL